MPAKVTHKFNKAVMEKILTSPIGGVAKDMLKRGVRVQARARRNLSGVTGSGPRRVNTGLLRASIFVKFIPRPQDVAVRVGTDVYYAIWIHDGTGIYGPKHTPIKPKQAKVLAFRSKVYGAKKGKYAGWVFARSVKGMKPNPFLKNALEAADGKNPA